MRFVSIPLTWRRTFTPSRNPSSQATCSAVRPRHWSPVGGTKLTSTPGHPSSATTTPMSLLVHAMRSGHPLLTSTSDLATSILTPLPPCPGQQRGTVAFDQNRRQCLGRLGGHAMHPHRVAASRATHARICTQHEALSRQNH
ncbi:hypothetical protein Pelo_17853 [Pelomyxa schiedti]|nr:hypothetical protein Pelo_17853 [Pelomyxa schiedti]